jgi:hypothetical protein
MSSLKDVVKKALDLVGGRQVIWVIEDVTRIALGGIKFAQTGETPPRSHSALIRLFCNTGELPNRLMHRWVSLWNPPYPFKKVDGVLGKLDEKALSKVTADLDEYGYHVFENRLSDELCDKILKYSLSEKSSVRAMDGQSNYKPLSIEYDRDKPLGIRYDFTSDQLISNPDIQALLGDTSLIAVAQSYLRAAPIVDVIAMWWHTAFSYGPDAQAAQFYHFDMDRIKWLKFFFYVTDVSTENGPHCFVAGSHRHLPLKLRKKGYARLTDEEVKEHFTQDQFIEFAAPRGTIIAEDTRGLHKGKHVQKGDRLVFQLQYSNSLFGTNYAKWSLKKVVDSRFKKMIQEYPRIFSNFKS